MFCRNCGCPMNDNQAICLRCGVETGQGVTFCSNCGQPVYPGAAVCLKCGVAIPPPKPINQLGGQDKTVIALICFLFGGLGIHNFMMGENKKGLFRLLTTVFCCGIGCIFALIDLVKLLMDNYQCDPSKLI